MNTFVSTTVQCARCHNHKFDAVTQQHYFNLQAVFAAVDKADRVYDVDTSVISRRQEIEQASKDIKAKLEAIQQEIAKEAGPEYQAAMKEAEAVSAFSVLDKRDDAYGYHSAMNPADESKRWVQVDLGESLAMNEIRLHPCSDDFGGIGNGFGFPVRFQVEVSDDPDFKQATLVADENRADYPNLGIAYYAVKKQVTGRYIRLSVNKLFDRAGRSEEHTSELQSQD